MNARWTILALSAALAAVGCASETTVAPRQDAAALDAARGQRRQQHHPQRARRPHGHTFVNEKPASPTSTRTVSWGLYPPRSSSSASGSCSCFRITRFSGRAPYAGS